MVARVFIGGNIYSLDHPYDYIVPRLLESRVSKGIRVLVPFGASNRHMEAVVVELFDKPQTDMRLKPILSLIDDVSLIDDKMLALAGFIKERCFSTFYDAIRVILPAGSAYKEGQTVSIDTQCPKETMDKALKNQENAQTISFIEECGSRIDKKEIKRLPIETKRSIARLIKAGVLILESYRQYSTKDKTVSNVSLAAQPQDALEYCDSAKGRQKQKQVVELLIENGTMSINEIGYITGFSDSVVNTLAAKGIVDIKQNKVYRNPYSGMQSGNFDDGAFKLTPDQQAAYLQLGKKIEDGKAQCVLFKGVTGSGKTMVFLHLIKKVIDSGKTAMILVPEIGLTPQMVSQFYKTFSDSVAVLHSGMTLSQRYDSWNRLKEGKASIVVGTRSAVFAPIDNIGIIIIDEEQEATYKSEQSPRYHARDIAKFRCVQNGALLLLSSATPSVDSMQSAKEGRYGLVELKNRFNCEPLPQVIIADMASELREGNKTMFSRVMQSELEKNLNSSQQSILFLNRRGFSTFVSCRECGYVAKCPNCSIALTYHRDNDRLMCHYCGYSSKNITACPDCKSGYVRFFGTGIQKVEQELERLFPNARIMRMDADTTSVRRSHEEILRDFGDKKGDILIGTQMVVKGLDFENVTFVGVIAADASLYLDDYRASENTFNMLTQVVGRAGRGRLKGRAVIQTYTPENPVILSGASQNYDGFFNDEIQLRKQMGYPPFCDLCVLTLSGPFEKAALRTVKKLGGIINENIVKSEIKAAIIGPAPSPIYKINGNYRFRIIIKCRSDKVFRNMISEILCDFYKDKTNKGFSLCVDINPYNMM